jgi:dTDP-4-dehydrorhamnose reductase
LRVLISGGTGQLGRELLRTRPAGHVVQAPGQADVDISSAASVERAVAGFAPALVINAAAYTAVDAAEGDREAAFRVNADGAANVARAAARCGARLVHVSTDFVFDGEAGRPYAPNAAPRPLGAYGESKARGEQAVREILPDRSLVLRTSWLYAAHGRNFVLTMLKLMRERQVINVVCDQIGCPTWANSLAAAIWAFVARGEVSGIYHWSDAGAASWYDFACAVREQALAIGLLASAGEVVPILTRDYPTAARRPPYSVLDCSASWAVLGHRPRHWREALNAMLCELGESPHA